MRSDRPGQPRTWRFSLEEAGTGDKRSFRDLEALLACLQAEVAKEDGQETGPAEMKVPGLSRANKER